MLRKLTPAIFCAALAVAALASNAHAQSVGVARGFPTGTSPMNPPNATGAYSMGSDDSSIMRERTATLTGRIASVSVAEGKFALTDEKTGMRVVFTVAKETKLRADKQTALAGRKEIKLEDFKPGDPVRLTFRLRDARPFELRLRREKNDGKKNDEKSDKKSDKKQ